MPNRKIGRNERCPCGSSKKYKHCCGRLETQTPPRRELPREAYIRIQKIIAEQQAKEARRRQQQGLGRPIISTELAGHRIVAVGKTLHWSTKWKTFHDFLFDYIKDIFGRDWGSEEQKKPLSEQHILLRWAHEIGEYHRAQKALAPEAKIISSPSTPVLNAYLGLAYNLYLMKHNAKLQRVLIDRLKNPEESSFHGAYYETFVAGTFIKAGYEIAFENEQDGSASHCEFVATTKAPSRKFSVEAKARFRGPVGADVDPKSLKLGVRDKLEAALQKQADHTRVIFIDINMPEKHVAGQKPFWVDGALSELRDQENTMIAAGQNTPDAYVIVTNHPYQFEIPGGLSAVMEGFNQPDFKLGAQFPNLRAALDARDRHSDIANVFKSMQKHYEIPATFDGEIPETHFDSTGGVAALKVGGHYLVPDENGIERRAELENASVLVNEKKAYGVYRLDDGHRIIVTCPMSDQELEAYRKYPETFFGTIDTNANRKCNDILDWYDFFFESYAKTSKEKLLEFMKDANDLETLKTMTQEALAKTYCERLAYNVELRGKRKANEANSATGLPARPSFPKN
jgi:hypothetical protein